MLAEWRELADRRRALMARRRDHGIGTVAWQDLGRRDMRLCGRMLDLGRELRALGVQPPRR